MLAPGTGSFPAQFDSRKHDFLPQSRSRLRESVRRASENALI
jgi:hypothetical protein